MPRETGHVHEPLKRSKRFIDFCHYVVIEHTCSDCGETYTVSGERNFERNPIQIVFAREDCPRCRELARGLEPASWTRA